MPDAVATYYSRIAPQLRAIGQANAGRMAEALDRLGVTAGQIELLGACLLLDTADQSSLARALGIDAASVMTLVDRLEAAGLVRREAGADRRRRIVRARRRAAAIVESGLPILIDASAATLAVLGAEAEDFLGALSRLASFPGSGAPDYDSALLRSAPGYAALSPLFETLGFLARRAGQVCHALYEQEGAACGANGLEYLILHLVDRGLIANQADFTRAIGVSRSSSLPAIRRLEQRHCLVRERAKGDARLRVFRLTPTGKALHAAMDRAADAYEQRLLAALAPRARPRFLKNLRAVLMDVRRRAAPGRPEDLP